MYFEPYVDVEGLHVPSYSDILEHLMEEYHGIFGADAYLGEETPDYQLMSVYAKTMSDFSNLVIEAYNSRNPYFATGNSLDLLVSFGGLTRRSATASHAVLKLGGEEGTVINAGKQAIDVSGNIWELEESVTIDNTGYGEGSAVCKTLGAIVAPIDSISNVYTPVLGWVSVTNEEVGDGGLDTESDIDLRNRFFRGRFAKVGGMYESFINGIMKVSGVRFVDVVSNDTNSTVDSIPAHSICAIVDGGDADDIAENVFNLKPPGVGTYGNVTKTVVDINGHENTVKFSRPTEVTVAVAVTIIPLSGYDGSRILPIIKGAIVDDINNLGIGKNWNVTMAYKDVYSLFGADLPFSISAVSATNIHGTSTSIMECGFDEMLVTDDTHITITVVE